MKDTNAIQLTFAVIGGWRGFYLGGFDGFIYEGRGLGGQASIYWP